MADNDIAGTTWVVQQIGADPTRPPLPEITFGADGRLTGTTGVNRLIGSYESGPTTITFGPAGSTRMAGPPELMEQERAVTAALEGEVPFELTGDRLTLGAEGTVLLLVRPSTQPVPPVDAGEVLAPNSPAQTPGAGITPQAWPRGLQPTWFTVDAWRVSLPTTRTRSRSRSARRRSAVTSTTCPAPVDRSTSVI